MRKFRYFWMAVLMLCGQNWAAAQNSRSLISGFELGSVGEGFATGGTVQSAIVRSGNYAYRANPLYSTQSIAFYSRAAGGTRRAIFRSSRFYLRVEQYPVSGSVAVAKIGGAGTFNPELDLNWDGTLTLADSWSPLIAKSQRALVRGVWHRIEFDIAAGLRVYVDGELWAAGGSMSYPAAASIVFGAGASPTTTRSTCDLYFDDILIDSGSFGANLPGEGRAVLLRTIGDPPSLNSWTSGAGAQHSLWMPLNNVPAAGLPAASATNMSQIRNKSQSGNLDYKPAVQTYASAGIPAGAKVNAVMALSNDGQEATKGKTRSGGLWIEANPAQAAPGHSFDFGDNEGVIGAFPTGWKTHYGPVTSNPAVDVSAAPVVAIRKASGSDVDVDFLGVYVDWRP